MSTDIKKWWQREGYSSDPGARLTRESARDAEIADLRAALAAATSAQPVVLVEALNKIIAMNRQHAEDQYGDAGKAEYWGCIVVARAALAAATAPQPAAQVAGLTMTDEEIHDACDGVYLADFPLMADYDIAIARAILAAKSAPVDGGGA